MKTIGMAEAKSNLSELASRTRGGERFQLMRRGRPIAALVPVEDLARLERRDATEDFLTAARRFAASLPRGARDLPDLLPPRRRLRRPARTSR